MAKTSYRDGLHLPPDGTANGYMTIALRIVIACRGRCPSVKFLIEHFGMHRATAYRWKAAWSNALRTNGLHAPPPPRCQRC
jgi:transposase